MRYAVVTSVDIPAIETGGDVIPAIPAGSVVNVIELDPAAEYQPEQGTYLIASDSLNIGDLGTP